MNGVNETNKTNTSNELFTADKIEAVKQEGRSLVRECIKERSRFFIVLDKMLLEENYRTIEGRKELVLFIRRHMIRILKNKYFNRNRKISAMILFLNLELYRKLVFISEEKKK